MFEDLKFYKLVFNLCGDGYCDISDILDDVKINFGFVDDYNFTTEIYCSSVELPSISYKQIDTQYVVGMINRGLYTVKFIQTGKSYNNLEDLHHDYLVLKLAGINNG